MGEAGRLGHALEARATAGVVGRKAPAGTEAAKAAPTRRGIHAATVNVRTQEAIEVPPPPDCESAHKRRPTRRGIHAALERAAGGGRARRGHGAAAVAWGGLASRGSGRGHAGTTVVARG